MVDGDFYYSGPAILDCGSNISVLPASHLNPDILAVLKKDPKMVEISGVGGKVSTIGHFTAKLKLGQLELPKVKFLVADQNTPCLLGQNIIYHEGLSGFEVDYRQKFVAFKLADGTYRRVIYSKSGSGDPVAQHQAKNAAPSGLAAKLLKLKADFGIKLPADKTDTAMVEKMADCLLENSDVFGDDDNMGQMVGEVATLPTFGEAAKK